MDRTLAKSREARYRGDTNATAAGHAVRLRGEDERLLRLELGLRQDAGLLQLGQLLELRELVLRRHPGGGRGGRSRRGILLGRCLLRAAVLRVRVRVRLCLLLRPAAGLASRDAVR